MSLFYVGIDPHEDGFTAVLWQRGGPCRMIRFNNPEDLHGSDKWQANLASLAADLYCEISPGDPTVCIEVPHTTGQIAGDELFRTAHVAGFLRGYLEAHNLRVIPIRRREVKSILLCSASGTDAQVASVVKSEIGIPGTKKTPGPTFGISGDGWQALAAALAVRRREEAEAWRVA